MCTIYPLSLEFKFDSFAPINVCIDLVLTAPVLMATSTELSVNDVANALQELTWLETKDLTFKLGLKLNVLDSIETDRSGNDRKTHSIQYWLDNDLEASWGRIISGLRAIGKKALAESVATQYCPQARVPVTDSPSSDPSSSATVHAVQPAHPPPQAPVSGVTQSSVNPESAVTDVVPLAASSLSISISASPPDSDRIVEVKAAVAHLEQQFRGIVMKFQRAMTRKETNDSEFLGDFRVALSLLPVTKQVSHARFLAERDFEIIAAKRVRTLITILCRYWNFSNYDLLQYLIGVFGEEPLKGDMKHYCEVLDTFEIETTIDIFLAAFSANSKSSVAFSISVDFSRMVVKINKPPCECTLHDIRVFREALAVQSSFFSHCIYAEAIAASSVRVTLGFHPSALGWVLAALSRSFLESHQLSDIVMEGKPLVVYETGNLVYLTCVLYIIIQRYT